MKANVDFKSTNGSLNLLRQNQNNVIYKKNLKLGWPKWISRIQKTQPKY